MRWIFVAGCGHTGTTITAKVVGLNDAVYGHEEESSFLSPANSCSIGKAMKSIRRKARTSQSQVICEKTPKHIHYIDYARDLLPGSRFVLCTRSPCDTIASLAARERQDIDRSAIKKGFKRYMLDNIDLIRQMHHPDVILHRYEDFVQDPDKSVRQLCSHLELDYDTGMLQTNASTTRWFNKDGDSNAQRVHGGVSNGQKGHTSRRSWQVNQAIFDNRGKWRTLLEENQVTYLNRLLDRPLSRWVMNKLGYSREAFRLE